MKQNSLAKILTLILALILSFVYYKKVGDKGVVVNIFVFMLIYIISGLIILGVFRIFKK